MSTLYIYLDESGEFQTGDTQCLIAGFVYTAKNGEPAEEHRKTIRRCMASAAEKWNVAFPGGVHSTGNDALKKHIRNEFESIAKALLKGRRYTPFVTFCLPDYLPEPMRAREHVAEGLYRHMLQQVLRHVIARYPEAEKIHLFIPTRNAPVAEDQQDTVTQAGLRDSGESTDGQKLYELNASGVHLFTRDELLKITNADITVYVNRVEYNSDLDDYQNGYRFADWVCCLCSGYCWTERIAHPGCVDLAAFARWLSDLFGKDAHVISYGPMYDLFFAAAQSAASPCPDAYLMAMIEFARPENAQHALYRDMLRDVNPFADPARIQAVSRYLFDVYYKQARYRDAQPLYAALLDLARQAGACPESLIDVNMNLMGCYQHTGEPDRAHALFEESFVLPMRDTIRLGFLNRYIQTLLDMLDFERAKAYIEDAMRIFGQRQNPPAVFAALRCPQDPEMQMTLSKCFSTRGQISGFLGESDGYAWFDRALQGFAPGSPNHRITLGHRLHYALTRLDFDEFGRYAAVYFDSDAADCAQLDTWSAWYTSLLIRSGTELGQPQPDTSSRFAFQLYYKALCLYCTHKQPDCDDFRRGVYDLLFSGGDLFALFDELDAPMHPFETIYKYIALLARYCDPRDGSSRSDQLWKEIDACITRLEAISRSSQGTVRLISQIGLCQLSAQMQSSRLAQRSRELHALLTELSARWQPLHEGGTSRLGTLLAGYNRAQPLQNAYDAFLTYEYT